MAKNLRDRGYSSSMDGYKLKKVDPASKYHSREKTVAPGTATVSKGQKSGYSSVENPKLKKITADANVSSVSNAFRDKLRAKAALPGAYGYDPTENAHQNYLNAMAEFKSDAGYKLGAPEWQQKLLDADYELQSSIANRIAEPQSIPKPKTPEQAKAYSDYLNAYARYEALNDAMAYQTRKTEPPYDWRPRTFKTNKEQVNLQPEREAERRVEQDIANYNSYETSQEQNGNPLSTVSTDEIKRRMQELEGAIWELYRKRDGEAFRPRYMGHRQIGGEHPDELWPAWEPYVDITPELNDTPYYASEEYKKKLYDQKKSEVMADEENYESLFTEYNKLKNEYNVRLANYLQSVGR